MSFPPATEMFQFAGFASHGYVFTTRYPKWVGCPIRRSPDQSLLAAPQGFSQPVTSFIASQCQGIHQMPFRHLITLNHTQGTRDPEVRGQVSGIRSPKIDMALKNPNPAYEIRSIYNGMATLFKFRRGLVTGTSTEQQPIHRTDRTRDRQKTCQQRRPLRAAPTITLSPNSPRNTAPSSLPLHNVKEPNL